MISTRYGSLDWYTDLYWISLVSEKTESTGSVVPIGKWLHDLYIHIITVYIFHSQNHVTDTSSLPFHGVYAPYEISEAKKAPSEVRLSRELKGDLPCHARRPDLMVL